MDKQLDELGPLVPTGLLRASKLVALGTSAAGLLAGFIQPPYDLLTLRTVWIVGAGLVVAMTLAVLGKVRGERGFGSACAVVAVLLLLWFVIPAIFLVILIMGGAVLTIS